MSGKHRTPRTPRNVVETSDYVAFLTRVINGYGDRIAEDPVALAHLADLQATLTEAVNRGIYTANKDEARYSQNHMAAILGVSRQAVAKRIGLGERVYEDYWTARAGHTPMVRLADVRARRAELLDAAGVQDVTGSVRELAAGNVAELRRAIGQ